MVDSRAISRTHNHHAALHLKSRPVGQLALEHFKDLSIAQPLRFFKRSQEGSSNKCTKNDKSALCGKPSETNNVTLPVVLGIVIPLGAALILFIFLHRRHVRKLRQEDANDPHKSLDFGLEPSAGKKQKKTGARNTVGDLGAEKPAKHDHGMSMDMINPYLLPPGLQGSRESLHSLSRTMHGGDDRYRPATTFIPNDSASIKSYPENRNRADDSSSFAGSGSSGQGYGNDKMNQSLLKNAQRMSMSLPITQNVSLAGGDKTCGPQSSEAKIESTQKPNLSPGVPTDTRDSYTAHSGSVLRKSTNYLGLLIESGDPSTNTTRQTSKQTPNELLTNSPPEHRQINSPKSPPPTLSATSGAVRPPRLQSLNAPTAPQYPKSSVDDGNHEREALGVTPASPEHFRDVQRNEVGRRPNQEDVLPPDDRSIGRMEIPMPAFDVRRLSMGFRPLPPEDPSDNPEQRAIRIRSFYKEYFDDSKPGAARTPGDHLEDNYQDYLGGGTYYSPAGGHFIAAKPPFAQPVSRRAMTPPPRAPPRFQGPARHQASFSGGGFTPRGPRSFSSASDRFGFPARGSSRPALPPPGPLRILPSPHLIKEDSFGIPVDFAPPTSYKDRQAGRPDSPKGGMRPYSPMLPAHLPLASSFDDLCVMPSPHSLRKSGTFTALDFAPPPRFKNSDNGSDSGSIRSNRSAMSAQQLHNIRAGAYRVSRIPKEVVGTRNEINDSLRPQWGIRP